MRKYLRNDCSFYFNPLYNPYWAHMIVCSYTNCLSPNPIPICINLCNCWLRKRSLSDKNNKSLCKEGKYGLDCSNDCKCNSENTLKCDSGKRTKLNNFFFYSN